MKKTAKILSILLAVVMMFTVTACGNGNKVDKTKEQIYVYAVNNGMGYEWVQKFAEEFNALPENSQFEIVPQDGSMDLVSTLKARVQAGTTEVNIYFGCQSGISSMIDENLLIDLSDVYQMKVDGNDTTIAEKTYNYDIIQKAFTKLDGTGIYAVPYSIGFGGMIFDYKYFVEKGFLNSESSANISKITEQGGKVQASGRFVVATEDFGNYKKGDRVLTPGKDGEYGTYDDGQVTTYAEFKTLLAKIMQTNEGGGMISPFLYSTQYVDAYTPVLYEAIMAQHMGYDNFFNYMALNGEIKDASGDVQANVTPATGYEVFATDVVKDAYETAYGFYYDTIMGQIGEIDGTSYTPIQLIHKSSYQTSGLSNTATQAMFITAPVTTSQVDAAFMIEGNWWEGEATGYFKGLESYDEPDEPRGYGKREYRFYLYPNFEGQITAENKTVFACQDDGCGVLLNNLPKKYNTAGMTDEKYIQKCKEFIAYTLSNKSLEYYTATQGIPRPYNYTLSDESYKALTPFQRNAWDITHDTDNIQIIFPQYLNNMSAIRSYGGFKKHNTNKVKKGNTNVAYNGPYSAFKDTENALTLTEYLNGLQGYVNENYTIAYNTVKDYIND